MISIMEDKHATGRLKERLKKYSIPLRKILYSSYSKSTLVLIKSDISGYLKARHTSTESDGRRDLQWITAYVDGKYGYVREGKPACPNWSAHLYPAQREEESERGHPIILELQITRDPTFSVYPFDLILAHFVFFVVPGK